MPAIALQGGGAFRVLTNCGAVVRTLGSHATASRIFALLNVFCHLKSSASTAWDAHPPRRDVRRISFG